MLCKNHIDNYCITVLDSTTKSDYLLLTLEALLEFSTKELIIKNEL